MASQVRQPLFWLEVGGTRVPVLETEILISWDQESDYCETTLPLYTSPGPSYWASVGSVDCNVVGRNDAGGEGTLFIGGIDAVRLDFVGGTVLVLARGHARKLIDKKYTKKYADQTAADIIKDVASQAGMQAQTDTFSDKAGKINTQEYAHLLDMQTGWDVIVYLAQKEGKVPFVKDSTVYFKDAGQAASGSGVIQANFVPPSNGAPATGNVLKLTCQRNSVLGGGKATVNSFHSQEEQVNSATKSWGSSGADGSDQARVYEFRFPNLTSGQTNTIAGALASQISANEVEIEVEMPGDVATVDYAEIAVSGTGTAFDQSYAIYNAVHRLSYENGYTMTILARQKGQSGS